MFSNSATSLTSNLVFDLNIGRGFTYSNDGDPLNGVFKALWLGVGVFGHAALGSGQESKKCRLQ